jgi:ParB family chromosome partitioning protein
VAKLKKGGLGRGLGALISGPGRDDEPDARTPISLASGESGEDRILHLDPHGIKPNPKQPRVTFDEEALEELAESIRRDGVFEPIIVRKADHGYELVSGERRVRACIMAGLETVPALCREVSDSDMLKLGLIENIQREDLNAIELAEAYQSLINEFAWTQEELSAEVGKKRATVTNTLRLLNLPGDVQRAVAEGAITMGHARALLALDSPKDQSAACRTVIEQGLSVRQAEKLAAPAKPRAKRESERNPHVAAIEDNLRKALGTKVSLRTQGADASKGKIEIEYYSLDDLERILDVFRVPR